MTFIYDNCPVIMNPAHIIAIFTATIPISSAETVRFIPATPDNTTLVDGTPVNTKDDGGAWKWLHDEGKVTGSVRYRVALQGPRILNLFKES